MSDADAIKTWHQSTESAGDFVPHTTLVINPMLDENDEKLTYGSGKSSAVHLLEGLYGKECYGKTLADIRQLPGSDMEAPVHALLIDAIPVFRSLMAKRIKSGDDLVQVFVDIIEKEQAQHNFDLEVLVVFIDNYNNKPMAKGAEDRKRATSQVVITPDRVMDAVSRLWNNDVIPDDFEELCQTSRIFITGMVRYCIANMLNETDRNNQVAIRKNLSVYLFGHYLQEGDVPRLDDKLDANNEAVRNDVPLELKNGNMVRWRPDLKMNIGEGDMMIPAMMRLLRPALPTKTTFAVASFDTDLLWISAYACHTWLDTDAQVVVRNKPGPAWVASGANAPFNAKWIHIRLLMRAIQKDPVFSTLKVPVASTLVSIMCGGNDYIDGTPRVPLIHYFNAYRLAAPLIGDLVHLNPNGQYWELDAGAFRRLVSYACWWQYQAQYKWDKKSVVPKIEKSPTGSKKIPQNLVSRARNVRYFLFMLNQAGSADIFEPPLAKYGFERVDRTEPWSIRNIQYQQDDKNPDEMASDAERFWLEGLPQQEMAEEARRMGIAKEWLALHDLESQRARDSASVDEAEKLLRELGSQGSTSPSGQIFSGGDDEDAPMQASPEVIGPPSPLTDDDDDDDDGLPGLTRPLVMPTPQQRRRGLSSFATPTAEKSSPAEPRRLVTAFGTPGEEQQQRRRGRFQTPETERIDRTPVRQRPFDVDDEDEVLVPATPPTEEVERTVEVIERKRSAEPTNPNLLTMVADAVFIPRGDVTRTIQEMAEGEIDLADLQSTVPRVLNPLFKQILASHATAMSGRVFFTYDIFDMHTEQMVRDTVASVFYVDPQDPDFTLMDYFIQRLRRVIQDLDGEFRGNYMRRIRRRIV